MAKVRLIALGVVLAVQVSSAYELAVPVSRQPYGVGDTSRIIGGETATKGQFPHQVAMIIDGHSFCGGSLISKNWVLTAAHCVDDYKLWMVILGAQNIRDLNETERITIFSKKGIFHEKYNLWTVTNDIGVVNLPEDVTLSDHINIIPLPPKSFQKEDFTGKKVRVSGWGRTSDASGALSSTLQFVDLTIISLKECQDVFGPIITETKYCCSGAEKKGTCNGDSGSSLTIGTGKDLTHLGIVSFGSAAGCAKGYPSGYTATPHFLEWLSEKTGIPIQD